MDNLTHSLIGLAAGEAIYYASSARKRRQSSSSKAETVFSVKQSSFRKLLLTVSVIANNFPDLDFLYVPFMGGQVGYLIHHRGYTHTLILVPVIAALFTVTLGKVFGQKLKKAEWALVFLTAIIGGFLHIFADSWNSYGVHPFWPFSGKWHYGDFMFIIEPWLWMSLLPLAIWTATTKLFRVLFLGFFIVGGAVTFFSGFVPILLSVFILLWGLNLLALLRPMSVFSRLLTTFAASIVVLGTFFLAHHLVEKQFRIRLAEYFPNTHVHDIILNPQPGNPLCWRTTTVETTNNFNIPQEKGYILRQAVLALSPKYMGAADCPTLYFGEGLIHLKPVPAPHRPDILWIGQYEAKVADLKKLKNQHCSVSAYLRFSRAPVWQTINGRFAVTDLRFHQIQRKPSRNMFLLTEFDNCKVIVPEWEPPRKDIIK